MTVQAGYNIEQLNFIQTSTSTDNLLIPEKFNLKDAYPNPFNPTTQISYDLPREEFVDLSIYDLTGRKVKSLVNENQSEGQKTIQWDATNDNGLSVSAGVYLYTIKAGEYTQTKKIVLLK